MLVRGVLASACRGGGGLSRVVMQLRGYRRIAVLRHLAIQPRRYRRVAISPVIWRQIRGGFGRFAYWRHL